MRLHIIWSKLKSLVVVIGNFSRKDASLTHEDGAELLRFCQLKSKQRKDKLKKWI
uniref:Uncharacterized protein n=1 Tax=Nelumbo nucifera TaxID=4432 RepID=A0A822ZWD7_NELNU|nr:TPA_asm: hypothetical protein HUJ06_017582 [Nelumbo nucifera]